MAELFATKAKIKVVYKCFPMGHEQGLESRWKKNHKITRIIYLFVFLQVKI